MWQTVEESAIDVSQTATTLPLPLFITQLPLLVTEELLSSQLNDKETALAVVSTVVDTTAE